MNTEKTKNRQYSCCFCRYFQLEGYRWGYCNLLSVYVQGNKDACQVSVSPFAAQKNSHLAESTKIKCQECREISWKT